MPLMTTKPMFDLAYDGGFAVGAFNVNNMELAQASSTPARRRRAR
jgi:fructose-bisphosphate aldolase class II